MKCNTFNFSIEFNALNLYLKAFAYKLTKDTHRAEDLFQDTAFLAFKNKSRFQTGTNMKAWASTIMRNAFINKFRKKQRRGDFNGGEELLDLGHNIVLNQAEETLAEKEILQLVGTLKRKYRDPFVMSVQGYKYKEISEQMNLPLGTINSRIFEARKVLRAKVKNIYSCV